LNVFPAALFAVRMLTPRANGCTLRLRSHCRKPSTLSGRLRMAKRKKAKKAKKKK